MSHPFIARSHPTGVPRGVYLADPKISGQIVAANQSLKKNLKMEAAKDNLLPSNNEVPPTPQDALVGITNKPLSPSQTNLRLAAATKA